MKKKVLIIALIAVTIAVALTACGQKQVDYTDVGEKVETLDEALEVVSSISERNNFVLQTVSKTDVIGLKSEHEYLLECCENGVRVTTSGYNEMNGQTIDSENQYYYIKNGDKIEYVDDMGGEYVSHESNYNTIEEVVNSSEEYIAAYAEIMRVCVAGNWDEESKTFSYVDDSSYGYSISVTVYTGAVAYVKEDISGREEIMFCGFGQVNVEKPSNSFFDKLLEAFR